MAVKIGNLDISAFKVGSSSCSVYLRTTKLYPLVNYKFQAIYSDSSTYNEECDGTTTLTTATTKPSGFDYTAMTTAIVGNCINSLSNYTFNGFTSLTSVTISNTVTSIGTNAFNECTNLSVVNIPTSVTTIGENTFRRCYSLSSITIPIGVTTIGNSAFVSCTGLTNVVIPSGVTSIGNQAFYYCSSLSSITVDATTPPTLGTNAFNNTNDCPIYVPSEAVEDYKTAWNSYTTRIQAITT